jgi:hypothetical protein
MQAIKRKEGDARNEGGRRNPPGIRDLFVSSGESLNVIGAAAKISGEAIIEPGSFRMPDWPMG